MSLLDIVIEYRVAFLSGLKVTLQLCLFTRVGGIVIGSLMGIVSDKFKKSIGLINSSIAAIVGGVPVLVFLYWMYFPFQQYFQININSFYLAAGCLIVINSLMVSKIIRTAINNMPKQYLVSAKVSGISKWKTLSKIRFPLIFKHVIGPIIIVQITMMHNTIFASLINVDDIFRQVQRVNAVIYKPIELYSLLAFGFIIVSIPLYLLASHFKRKYSFHN